MDGVATNIETLHSGYTLKGVYLRNDSILNKAVIKCLA